MLNIGSLAATLGVSVSTLRRWDRQGILKPKCRTAGGHRRYVLGDVLEVLGASSTEGAPNKEGRLNVAYARVSSCGQKPDLERQIERLRIALAHETNVLFIKDLGSGLNFKKRGLTKLMQLITSDRVEKLYLTHKDRLVRFGYEMIESLLKEHGGEIIILEEDATSATDELAKDVLSVMTVFSARLHGRRAHQHQQTPKRLAS